MPPDFSDPAVLVLDIGQYIRGWTMPGWNAAYVQGQPFQATDYNQQPEVYPLDEGVLRGQSVWVPGVTCYIVAAVPVLATALEPFMALPNSVITAVTVGLVLAPFLTVCGLLTNRVLRLRRWRQLGARPHVAL